MKAQFATVQSDVDGLRSQLAEAVTLVLALRTEIKQLKPAQQNVHVKRFTCTPPAEPSAPPQLDLEAIAASPDYPAEDEEYFEEMKVLSDDDVSLSDTEQTEVGVNAATPTPVTATALSGTATVPEAIPLTLPQKAAIAEGDELTRPQLCEYFNIRPNAKTLKNWEDSGKLLSKYGWRRVRGSQGRGNPLIYRYEPQAIKKEELPHLTN